MMSYGPLFQTMKDKNISTYKLFKAGFQPATYYSMKKGNSVSTNTIEKLCKILDCSVSEVIEYIPDENIKLS